MIGYASLNGGTTGGAGGQVVQCATGDAIQAALAKRGKGATTPLVIEVTGRIDGGNTALAQIDIAGQQNLTIRGADGAELTGVGLRIKDGSRNLVIERLRVGKVSEGPKDGVGIEGGVRNVIVRNCEFYGSMAAGKDTYDGLLDVKRESEYISVLHCRFTDHHKVSLVGYSDSESPMGNRFVTYYGNWFQNVGSRCPSVRGGFVHVANCLFEDVTTSGVNSRMGAVVVVEGNVFRRVTNPIVSIDSKAVGRWVQRDNRFEDCKWGKISGKTEASGQDGKSTAEAVALPYSLDLLPADRVEAWVRANAGLRGAGEAVPTPVPEPTPVPVPEPAPLPGPDLLAMLGEVEAAVGRLRKALVG